MQTHRMHEERYLVGSGPEGLAEAANSPLDNPFRQRAIDLLKTARGQVAAAQRMAEQGRNGVDVARQLWACIALLRKANLVMFRQQIDRCREEALRGINRSEEIAMIIDAYVARGTGYGGSRRQATRVPGALPRR